MGDPPVVALGMLVLSMAASAPVAAQSTVVTLEATGGMPLGAPQSRLFGPGGSLALSAYYAIAPQLLVGGRVRAVLMLDGDAPEDAGIVDPGIGTLEVVELAVRLRPFGTAASSRATGLFIDGGFGGGLTGEQTRAALEGGLGFGFDVGSFALAPVVRYLQVVQPREELSEADARMVFGGIELIFGGDAPPTKVEKAVHEEPSDRDGDGLADVEDSCPDQPEDHDGHADNDGCPDPDNDADNILDMEDDCPDEPEDLDGFSDIDGCPDPDNDDDSFPDEDDECPNEAEIVNGNKDYDGCPDEGLIEFKDDRIVLEERVLFDRERARIKRAGRPILKAIVQLQAQHPEWIQIRIEGHADALGDEEYNMKLSERRANNVRDSLVKLGIPASLIDSVGYGSSRVRDRRDDPEAHGRNRRVEFVVVARKGGPRAERTDVVDAGEASPEGGGSQGAAQDGAEATAIDAALVPEPPAAEAEGSAPQGEGTETIPDVPDVPDTAPGPEVSGDVDGGDAAAQPEEGQ